MITIDKLNNFLLKGIDNLNQQTLDPLDQWYEQSYQFVMKIQRKRKETFEAKTGAALLATGAWVKQIIKGNMDSDVITQLKKYRSYLPTTIADVVVGGFVNNRTQLIANKKNEKFEFVAYYKRCNQLVNSCSENRENKNAATVSKFMHFMSPNIFPIFDANIAKLMKLTSVKKDANLSITQYSQYIWAIYTLRATYKDTWQEIKKQAGKNKCSPIRYVDKLLFRANS